MTSCNDCKDKELCKKPCEWLEKELKKVELNQEHLTSTELGLYNQADVDG